MPLQKKYDSLMERLAKDSLSRPLPYTKKREAFSETDYFITTGHSSTPLPKMKIRGDAKLERNP